MAVLTASYCEVLLKTRVSNDGYTIGIRWVYDEHEAAPKPVIDSVSAVYSSPINDGHENRRRQSIADDCNISGHRDWQLTIQQTMVRRA